MTRRLTHRFVQTLAAALVLGGLFASPAMGQGATRESATLLPGGTVLRAPLVGPSVVQVHVPAVPARSALVKAPATLPKPFAPWSASVEGLRDSIVTFAERQLGVPYQRGATSPERGFDCSGFVKYVMSHFDIALPRTARKQAQSGTALGRNVDALRPGDLLTFGRGKGISHIGIYIGHGHFIHASNRRDGVKISSLSGRVVRWWKGARRIILNDSTLGANANTD